MLKPRFEIDPLEHPAGFRHALAEWFAKNGRDYPWRRTHDPYAVLVSEVMLQQTQVATVLGRDYFTRFLTAFPDPAALAAADDASLLKAWEGLGYYRRVRMLRETARAVMAEHGGVFPNDEGALMKLPGIGRYTAAAVRAFAFNLPAAAVDGNIARVIARLMDFSEPIDGTSGQKRILAWARDLTDPAHPRIYNSALMELGQTLCRPGVPDCLSCPVSKFCRTRTPELLPLKRAPVAVTAVDEHALWIADASGRVLLHREEAPRRQGLWKLPTRAAADISHLPVLAEDRYTITRYRVRLRVHDGSGMDFSINGGESWHEIDALSGLAMPSPFRRVIDRLAVDFGKRM